MTASDEAVRVAKVIAQNTKMESNFVTMSQEHFVAALREAYISGFNEASRLADSRQSTIR